MAGDWIKMEVCTPDKPEVFAIAAKMGWDDSDMAVGKLFRLWRWFDQHTTDGNASGVTSKLLDRYIGVEGFVSAVASVGWLSVTADGIILVNFDRHNGKTAKERANTAKRVAAFRSGTKCNDDGNAGTVTKTGTKPLAKEEKRREEKNKEINTTPEGVSDSVWSDFLKHRKANRAPVTATVIDGIKREADKAGVTLEYALTECCARGWRGFKAEWLHTTSRSEKNASRGVSEPAWRTEQRNRTIAAVPGIAERSPTEFFLDVEARNVTTPVLG